MQQLATRIARRLRGIEPSKPVPVDLLEEHEFLELAQRCRPYTMTSYERQFALYTATRHLHRAGIAGDFVECGVWRGGSIMLAGLTLQRLGDTERRLYLYDTFAGMTEPAAEGGGTARSRWGGERGRGPHERGLAPREGR